MEPDYRRFPVFISTESETNGLGIKTSQSLYKYIDNTLMQHKSWTHTNRACQRKFKSVLDNTVKLFKKKTLY